MLKIKLIIGVLLASNFGCFAQNKDQKPNILWILTDDHRYDAIQRFNQILHNRTESELGYVESPNADRLADMGTTFINTYCQAQVCAPSRASMHYGRYPFRSGIYEFEYHNNKAEHMQPTIPESMQAMGYQTLHIGKLGLRLKTLDNGKVLDASVYQQDISSGILAKEGLCEWAREGIRELNGVKLGKTERPEMFVTPNGKREYLYKAFEDKGLVEKGTAVRLYKDYDFLRYYKKNETQNPFDGGIIAGISSQPAGKTKDGYYTIALKDFLSHENEPFKMGNAQFNGVDVSKPLFCHLGYDFPHTPVLPPAEYRERFSKLSYKLPELTDAEWKTMPKQLKNVVRAYGTNHFTDAEKLKMIQDYFAFCAYGDRLVGEAADAFIAYSEKHNQPWLIMYVVGDHGWKLNDHGAIMKNTPWEIDSHNPIIVISSDKETFPAGKVVYDFTEFVDIAPTIIAAGGATIEDGKFNYLDGLDLAKVAAGSAPKRDYVIGESHTLTGPRAYIRTQEYVFSLQTRPDKNRGVAMDWALKTPYEKLDPGLYHITSDPNETNNLAFNPEYKDIALKMKAKLLNIVLGDNRVEIMWGGDNFGNSPNAIGTKVFRSNFAPGAHDYNLKL